MNIMSNFGGVLMKKILIALLAVLIFVSSIACTSEKSTKSISAANASAAPVSSSQSVDIDKGLLDISITLPASMLEGTDFEAVKKQAKEQGINNVTKNSDGSITYKMSKSSYNKILQSIKQSATESISEMKGNKDLASIEDIKFNNDFSNVDIIVNREKFENSFDAIAGLGVGIQGMYYQYFDGKNENTVHVKVNFIDTDTKEIIKSVTYPDALKNMSSSK